MEINNQKNPVREKHGVQELKARIEISNYIT
jgi:hypothetical protein